MFWRDPNLYGATFPYKDINTPVPTPYMGFGPPTWSNVPRFMPPTHMPQFTPPQPNVPQFNLPQFAPPQFAPPQFNVPQFNLPQPVPQPFNLPQPTFSPYLYPQAISPFAQIPYTPMPPYMPYPQAFDVNLYRPFIG